MRKRDEEHEERKRYLKSFPDGEILRAALDRAALDDTEREALRLYIFKHVPITVIAERMGYEKTYFSQEKFKRAIVKYVYCVRKMMNEKE